MNIQSQINPLASADTGGTAGYDAAACVSPRGKCDGASVCDARNARVPSPTTLPLQARQVVAPQAQNSGTGAAVSELAINPTIESAGSNTPAASTSTSKDTTKGKITAYFVKSTADGRARRSAVRGPSAPSVPSISIPVPTPAGVAPFDAIALAVPSVSIPVPTPAGVSPLDAVAPSVPSVSRRVKFDLPPAGVTPSNAVALSIPSVSPPAPRRRTVASTNDSSISQPTRAASQHSTNEFTSRTRLYVVCGSRLVASGIKLNAAAGTKAPPAQTSNKTIFTNNTSPNLGRSEESHNVTIEESPNVTIEESPNVTIEESPNVTIEESPNVTIEESSNVTIKELPNVTIKKSKTRLRENKKLKKQASEAKDNSSDALLPWANYTYAELRSYRDEMEMAFTGYTYALLPESPIDEFTPTQVVSGPPTPKPPTRSPRRPTPPTPPMSRLAKETAKNARNTPKAVNTSLAPLPLPQVVEAEQAPTTGIPPVPDPLEPTILPQAVEAEQTPTTGIPPVPVPLDPAPLPQDIETAGVHTPEPTTSPLEAVTPAPVPLTGAQTTATNTTRKRSLNAARLFRYRQGLNSSELPISEALALNIAARTSITAHTTRH